MHGNFIQILLHMKLKGLKLIDRLPSNIGSKIALIIIKCMIMSNYLYFKCISSKYNCNFKNVITIDQLPHEALSLSRLTVVSRGAKKKQAYATNE